MLESLFSRPILPHFEKVADPANIIHRAKLNVKAMQKIFLRPRDAFFQRPGKRDFFTLFMQQTLVQEDPELTESPSLQKKTDKVFSQKLTSLRQKTGLATLDDETFYGIVRPLQTAARLSIKLFNAYDGDINEQTKRQLRENYARAANKYDFALRAYRSISQREELSLFFTKEILKTPEEDYVRTAEDFLLKTPISALNQKNFKEGMTASGHVVSTFERFQEPYTLISSDMRFIMSLPTTNDTINDGHVGIINPDRPIQVVASIWITEPSGKINCFGLLAPEEDDKQPAYVLLGSREPNQTFWETSFQIQN